MNPSIGIAGGGIVGRLLALELTELDWSVSLFDEGTEDARHSCSFAAASLLSPLSELENSEVLVTELGIRSLDIWPKILDRLSANIFYSRLGTIAVAHHRDRTELERFQHAIESRLPASLRDALFCLDRSGLEALEPQLADRFEKALYLREEAVLDNRALLRCLAESLRKRNVSLHFGVRVNRVSPGSIEYGGEKIHFDWVADCRGLGAKSALESLRAVRGELILVRAPDVTLFRPVRLMHPRFPLYIAPRPDKHYIVGATSIESEDYSPISVRSALELLSAAFVVHPGFAEGRIVETITHCRPALPNNLPQIRIREGFIEINGLYRHGYLLGPAVVASAANAIARGTIESTVQSLFSEVA